MQLQSSLSSGVYAAALTPMKADLRIDNRRLASHCEGLLAQGCAGIVFMGTTGEANSFSVEERIKALDALLDNGIPAERLVVGAGCCALPDTLALSRHALSRDVCKLLLLPPFYYKSVSDAGLLAAFTQLIQKIHDLRLKIYLYHIPPMSSVPFSTALIGQLVAAFPDTIAGIKDSSGNWDNMRTLCKRFPTLQVFAGNERFFKDILAVGGAGCISATANVSAARLTAFYRDGKAATVSPERFLPFREVIERFPMIPALKQVMADITGEADWLNMRPPLMQLDKAQSRELTETLTGIGFPESYLNKQ